MNSNPVARNATHAEALEQYRLAEAAVYRFANRESVSNGRGVSWLQTQAQYLALVAARDDARAAVAKANPAGQPPKEKAKQ